METLQTVMRLLESNLVIFNVRYRHIFDPFVNVNFIEIKDQHIWYVYKDAYFIALSIEVANWRGEVNALQWRNWLNKSHYIHNYGMFSSYWKRQR